MSLKVCYWNCGSGLLKKIDFVRDQIVGKNVDAFFIAESEIKKESDLDCLNIQNYNIHLADTISTRGKTRLMCYAKQNLTRFKLGSDLNDLIALQKGDSKVIGIYRGFKCYPGETELTNYKRLLDSFDGLDLNKSVYILGDFNIDLNNHEAHLINELQEWCDSRGLLISSPGITRARWVLDR